MAERHQGTFAGKARHLLDRERPASMADLMGEENRETVYPEIRQSGRASGKVREEFRLPEDVAETLREYAHQQRMKKTAVVIEALREFFRHKQFPPA